MPPCDSPLASQRQVPTFRTVASLPAHAACMPATVEAEHRCPLDFVPGSTQGPGFDGIYDSISTPYRRFTCVRLLERHLTGSLPAFSTDAHHASCHPRAAPGGLEPGPVPRLRGAIPHQLCSMLPQGLDLDLASWRNESIELHNDEHVRITPNPAERSGEPRPLRLPSR